MAQVLLCAAHSCSGVIAVCGPQQPNYSEAKNCGSRFCHFFLFPFCRSFNIFNFLAGCRFVQDLERQDQSAISLSQPGRSWQLGFGMFVMCCSKCTL